MEIAKKEAIKQELLRALKQPLIIALLIVSVVLLFFLSLNFAAVDALDEDRSSHDTKAAFVEPEKGTWRFAVSGDSRNCGDVVVPAIAAQSLQQYQPAFYWHLGDLRAIYKIDEDMVAAASKAGQDLSCETYLKTAWPDFIHHQISAFGATRFYLGIGNHEVIAPKTTEEFSTEFQDWLATPPRQMTSVDRNRLAEIPTTSCGALTKKSDISALPYYHWIQGGVDFIYLDNSSGSFSQEIKQPKTSSATLPKVYAHDQLEWFDCVLELAEKDSKISTVVVGMHEALPHSKASSHAMCDDAIHDPAEKRESCSSGDHVYNALLRAQTKKHVYVLASHSHFYLKDIFEQKAEGDHLPGWIVGTAGAVRYKLPDNTPPGPNARPDVYGYLLATVKQSGEIDFDFKEVTLKDVPANVLARYDSAFPNWCFAHNSDNIDPIVKETTNRCVPPVSAPAKKPH